MNFIENSKNNILSDEEILKAKENGFILIGKTGVGKTTLLNILYGANVGKVGYSSISETSESKNYYIKYKNNNEIVYFSLIDTPGLYDTNAELEDDIHQKKTKELISKENIKIKGILFLSNFQNERFDFSEINTLIQYNAFFPLEDFWKHIILIFTHYYADPAGDTKEEMKNELFKNLSESFEKIMNRVKEVSEPVEFININKLFINMYSKNKNKIQMESNEFAKNQVIKEIKYFCKYKPTYNKLFIINFEKYKFDEKDETFYDCELILYLDSKNKIINRQLEIMNEYTLDKDNNNNIIKGECQIRALHCEIDKKGILHKKNTEKDIIKNIAIFGGCTIVSTIGILLTAGYFFFLGYLPGIYYFYKTTSIFKEYDKDKTLEENTLKELKLNEILKDIFKEAKEAKKAKKKGENK